MKVDLLIKNGKIVTPNRTYNGNIAVSNEKIVQIGDADYLPKADEVVDAAGKHIIPGVIDTHTHIGWPDWDWEEACAATTRAAAAGGVTTTLCYTGAASGGGADTVISGTEKSSNIFDEVNNKRSQFEKNSYIDGAFHSVIYSYDSLKDIVPMATKGGVSSFKFFLVYRSCEVAGHLDGVDDGMLYYGFKEIAKLKYPGMAMTHCENIEIFYRMRDKLLSEGGNPYWNDVRPNFMEVESVKKAIEFAKATDCTLYLVHMSTKEAREEVLRARAEGVNIYAETCPHYLVLNIDNADRVLGKVNPPVRTKEDSENLWRAIREGVITCIGSDHADCAKKHKQDFWSAIVGLPGIQTMLPLILSEGVNKGRITMEQAVAITSFNPAKTFNIYPKKGAIEVGSDADLVIVDMDMEKEVHIEDMHYISDFTPYEGMKLKGWPVQTFVRGKLVAKDNVITGEKGLGRFIPRSAELK